MTDPSRLIIGISGASGVIYGVRLLQDSDEASLDAITHSLEAAWRDGRVDLTLLQGRPTLEAAA